MRLIRPAVSVAVLASAFALAVPSDAAPAYQAKSFHLADAKGDGNAINNQGEPVSNASAPVGGYDGYDILGVDYKGTGKMLKRGRIYVPQCTGFTVKMTFGAAPGPSSFLRATGVGVVNDGRWWLQYDGKATTVRYGHKTSDVPYTTTNNTIDLKTPAKIAGATVTWTVLESDVKATGEKLTKFSISGLGASVRTSAGPLTAPQWDATPDGDAFFKAC